MASDGLLDLGLACTRLYWPQEGTTDGDEHPVRHQCQYDGCQERPHHPAGHGPLVDVGAGTADEQFDEDLKHVVARMPDA